MKKKKKPDLVVWSEEKGYYPRELTYGSNLGAPAIKVDNIDGWKQAKVQEVNDRFKTKYDELMAEAQKLVEDYNWNDFIYTKAEYTFQPVVGHVYHLYKRQDDSVFLSIITPMEWKMDCIGSFVLDSANKWVRI